MTQNTDPLGTTQNTDNMKFSETDDLLIEKRNSLDIRGNQLSADEQERLVQFHLPRHGTVLPG